MSSRPDPILLRYHKVSLKARGTQILDAVDLELEGPGIFALLGPSGVGKSSLLRLTQRLIEDRRDGWARTGDVTFQGRSVFRPDLSQRDLARRIGFVPQRPRMLAGSALDNVEFALRHTTRLSRSDIRAKAESVIEQVGLSDELKDLRQPAHQLSGGQGQRLAVARAIALDPEVLLLDEPISSLDPVAAEKVEAVIRAIGAQRLVVMVTHKVGSAVRLADHAGFLLRGPRGARLHDVGPASDVLRKPSNPVAREFVRMSYGMPDMDGSSVRTLLFVCGGNTARSPLAAAFCRREILSRLGQTDQSLTELGYRVESAGLDVDSPRGLDPTAADILQARDIEPPEHRSREVTAELVAAADWVFTLTESQRLRLSRRFPQWSSKIRRLDPVSDTPNPHGLGEQAMVLLADRVRDAVRYRMSEWGASP